MRAAAAACTTSGSGSPSLALGGLVYVATKRAGVPWRPCTDERDRVTARDQSADEVRTHVLDAAVSLRRNGEPWWRDHRDAERLLRAEPIHVACPSRYTSRGRLRNWPTALVALREACSPRPSAPTIQEQRRSAYPTSFRLGQTGCRARIVQRWPAGAEQQPSVVTGTAVGRIVHLDLPTADARLTRVAGLAGTGSVVTTQYTVAYRRSGERGWSEGSHRDRQSPPDSERTFTSR